MALAPYHLSRANLFPAHTWGRGYLHLSLYGSGDAIWTFQNSLCSPDLARFGPQALQFFYSLILDKKKFKTERRVSLTIFSWEGLGEHVRRIHSWPSSQVCGEKKCDINLSDGDIYLRAQRFQWSARTTTLFCRGLAVFSVSSSTVFFIFRSLYLNIYNRGIFYF